jgi:hypothetical protein
MTEAEWRASSDPSAMIGWLEKFGYSEPLWDFAVACCRRVADEMPAGPVRQVAEHVARVGTRDVDPLLDEASRALDKLERRLRRVSDATEAEQARLNRQLGFGSMVFAFQHQDGARAADAISRDLLEWVDDPDAESRIQAAVLRELVPAPCRQATGGEGEGAEPGAAPDRGGVS